VNDTSPSIAAATAANPAHDRHRCFTVCVNRATILLAVLLVVVGGAGAVRVAQFHGAAKPGVHVLGIDVGGKSRGSIEAAVRSWSREPVTVRAGGRSYHVARGWLVAVDARATAARALAAGSWRSLAVPQHVDVVPVIGRAPAAGNVLGQIAHAGRPPVSATLHVQDDRAVTTSARFGLTLDRAALLRLLVNRERVVTAPFARVRPAIGDAAAHSAAATVDRLLDAPVTLDYHGAHRGALSRAQLARALKVRAESHGFDVAFDGDLLARLVRPRLGKWIVRAHNAQFVLAGDRVRVAPSRAGRDVDPAGLADAVTDAAESGRVAEIELGPHEPDLTTAKADALGIRQKLVSYTTQMGESSSNRIHNVHLMADFIDGTIVKPGATFSFNDIVGPRTSERGFLEGQMIIGSLVLPSIGGGVCQTATTLFNDAFELGLPILERTNHNLYLAHYPLGRDATVSWGGPDFKFRNDLKHGLLIKASYTDQTLTFTVYGTPEGRRVVSRTGPQTRWTSPGMNYAIDPSAPRGSVKVVNGTGEQGFDIEVWRKVYDRNGKLLRSNLFKSHYIPDSPTTVYGPGRTPPGPYIVLPSTT
jgi:vancomycin resistance protein YoaR